MFAVAEFTHVNFIFLLFYEEWSQMNSVLEEECAPTPGPGEEGALWEGGSVGTQSWRSIRRGPGEAEEAAKALGAGAQRWWGKFPERVWWWPQSEIVFLLGT